MATFITKIEVETYARITTGSENTLLDLLISKASEIINSFCGRKLESTEYEELYQGNGGYELMLDHFPLISVTALSLNIDKENKTYSDVQDAVNLLLKKKVGIIELYNNVFSLNKLWNIYIKYTAGYTTIPEDIKLICLDMVAKKYFDSKQNRFGMESRQVMGQSITYNFKDISDENKNILKKYIKFREPFSVDVFGLGWTVAS